MKGFLSVILANMSFILVIFALISFNIAAFLVNLVAGYVILGLSFIILAYILAPKELGGE